MIHVVEMLLLVALPLCQAATLPQLLRKHVTVNSEGHIDERAPTGHKYRHLAGFQAAFEEMQAIKKSADAAPDLWADAKQSLAADCAALGGDCKKVVDLLEVKDELGYLCTPEALTCLAANPEKCDTTQAQLSDLQKKWPCEAARCSAAGDACSKTVLFLEMEDHELTSEQRQKKTRFLCSQEAKDCISEHQDVCQTAMDIVSAAKDLGHCDGVFCADKGPECQKAVSYLAPELNATKKESAEKWAYLCSETPLQCLEKHPECMRFMDAVKLGKAEGQCDVALCAREGPDCELAVKYLTPGATYLGEELKKKHDFLCSSKGITCIMNHPTCSEMQRAAYDAYESPNCPAREDYEVVKVENARSEAAMAFHKQKAKELEKKIVAQGAKATGESAEASDNEEKNETKTKSLTEEEKRKAGKKIFTGLIAVLVLPWVVALAYYICTRKKRQDAPSADAQQGKPPKPKTNFLHRVKQPLAQAASAIGEVSHTSLVARLKAFTGFGIFKKDEAAAPAEAKDAAPAEATEAAAAPQASGSTEEAPKADTSEEQPKEY